MLRWYLHRGGGIGAHRYFINAQCDKIYTNDELADNANVAMQSVGKMNEY
jgi:hypothetical protein